MESAKCKICFRQFSNRKALGGHMRSHMAKLSVVHQKKQIEEDHCSPKFPGHDDQESDTDTPNGQIIRRRSKRACRSINRNSPDDGSVVSVVDHHHHHHHALVSVEEAARLLLLLSRDHHRTTREREKRVPPPGKEHDFTLLVYRCETCHKGFQSYQALGGHRASHKKLKFESEEEEEDDDDDGADVAAAAPAHTPAPAPAPAPAPTNQRTFKCPFCFKVFESGQAMGGHKKIHMSSSAASRSLPMPMSGHSFIDLNLPAAPEDDNASQVDDPSII